MDLAQAVVAAYGVLQTHRAVSRAMRVIDGTCHNNGVSALCREGGDTAFRDGGARWSDVGSLQHHLDELDDHRKMLFAQTAVLVRCKTLCWLAVWKISFRTRTWRLGLHRRCGRCNVVQVMADVAPALQSVRTAEAPPYPNDAACCRRNYMGGAGREADLPAVQDVMRLLTQLSCNCHSIADNTLDHTGIKLGARQSWCEAARFRHAG